MLVAVAIFTVAVLIATDIFALATQASRRTAASQQIQGDVRFALESHLSRGAIRHR